jgi:hypothetical protein
VKVPEVLSSGPEPVWDLDGTEVVRRPRPRWLSTLGVVTLAAVLGVLAVRDGTGRPRPGGSAPPMRAAVATPAPSVPPGPPPPDAVYRLDGVPGPAPAGVRLLLGGLRPAVLDPGTGLLTPLRDVRHYPGDAVDLRRGPGLTVALVHSDPYYVRAAALPDGGRSADLGTVQDALPMRDGSVLTAVCLAGSGGGCSLSQYAGAGELRWQRRVSDRIVLLRDTPGGVLTLIRGDEARGMLQVENPRNGKVRRDLGVVGTVLAATDRQVAWLPPDCTSGCPVVVADLGTGERRELSGLAGRAALGAFSPDGQRLAVSFVGLDPKDPDRSTQRDGYLAVLDLRTSAWTRAPGLTTGAQTAAVPVWTPAGDRLLIGTGTDGVGRIAVWRPGDRRLTVLPVRLDGFSVQPEEFVLLD